MKKSILLIAYDPADTRLVAKALPRGCEESLDTMRKQTWLAGCEAILRTPL